MMVALLQRNFQIKNNFSCLSDKVVIAAIHTSISDLNDILVYLRFGNPDLWRHLEVLSVVVLVLLHEGRLDGLALFG